MSIIDSFLMSGPTQATIKWLANQGLDIIFICFFAWLFYHLVHFMVENLLRRIIRPTRFNPMSALDIEKRQKTLASLISTVFRILILSLAALLIFKEFAPSVNLTPVFAGAGIVGLALAFGMQSLLKDFMTGLFIITENQYRVGDVVDLDNGAAGTVERVGIRSTVLRDTDGNVHYLPNGSIGHVINKTMGFSKVNFTLSVDPDTDVDLLAQVINETGTKLAEDPKWSAKITEAPHFLNVGSFSQLGMDVIIVGITEPSEQWSVTGELRRRLLKQFGKHKIKLATAANPWQTPPKKK